MMYVDCEAKNSLSKQIRLTINQKVLLSFDIRTE